jgi:Spy/CpxP family protein refolding chaperone
MKARYIKIFGTVLAVMLVAAVAISQTVTKNHSHQGLGFEDRMVGFMTHRLNLSEDQQAQVKQILAAEKPTMLPLVKQLAQTRRQLRQLEEGGTFDEAKVRALASQQAQTMTDLIVERSKVKSEIFKLLTPEQKAKAVQLMDRREARFHRHVEGMSQPAPEQQ